MHVAIEVQGQGHEDHTHQQERQHGQEAEEVPESLLPARVVEHSATSDRIRGQCAMILGVELGVATVGVAVP